MTGKSFNLLLSTIAVVTALAAKPLLAAGTADWPFALLPKPDDAVANALPPEQTPAAKNRPPGAPTFNDLYADEYMAPKDLRIKLDQTENKSFRLSGEVWLDGPSPRLRYPSDEPAGFGLFLREIDGLHRYQVSSSRLLAKRRLLGGVPQTKIISVAALPDFPLHTWIPFSLEVTGDRITFSFGGYQREIRGPLDIDGINEIALVSGTKLRNMRLEIWDDAQNAEDWGRNP